MKKINLVLHTILAYSVSSSPIKNEALVTLCNSALALNANNEFSTILSTVPSGLNSNALAALTMQELTDQLYNSIIVGDYESAVIKSLQLEQDGKTQVIQDTVNKLLNDSKRNIVEYAYKLWNTFGKNIVKDYFPIQFRLVLNGDGVVFMNKKDGLPLTVAVAADKDGNRLALGHGKDRSSEQLRWSITPIWENNRVYFKIYNNLRHQYLKLGIAADSSAEHKAYSADLHDTNRQQWYFHPAIYENDILFYVTNREYKQALKLNAAVDNSGNRQLYSHNGDFIGNPETLGWYIKPF